MSIRDLLATIHEAFRRVLFRLLWLEYTASRSETTRNDHVSLFDIKSNFYTCNYTDALTCDTTNEHLIDVLVYAKQPQLFEDIKSILISRIPKLVATKRDIWNCQLVRERSGSLWRR